MFETTQRLQMEPIDSKSTAFQQYSGNSPIVDRNDLTYNITSDDESDFELKRYPSMLSGFETSVLESSPDPAIDGNAYVQIVVITFTD
jgi:hypothetical protein